MHIQQIQLLHLITLLCSMPLFYLEEINEYTRLAIWKIAEDESFFNLGIALKKEITHPHKRLQHLAGRFLLPLLFPDFPNKEIAIAETRKPYLPYKQYQFSISHCADYAAAIVSTVHRVGIDVEIMTPRIEVIKEKFLHPSELNFIHSNNNNKHLQLLSIAWSAKEALYKWYGIGGVDFSENMILSPFLLAMDGTIKSRFAKKDFIEHPVVHYEIFENLVLAFVVS